MVAEVVAAAEAVAVGSVAEAEVGAMPVEVAAGAVEAVATDADRAAKKASPPSEGPALAVGRQRRSRSLRRDVFATVIG